MKWLRNMVLAACLLASGPAAAGMVVINEVFYDAVGSDDGRVFVELFGDPGMSLDGFSIEGVNGSGGGIGPVLGLSGLIPGSGLFVVADGSGGSSVETEVPAANLILQFDFQNGPDSIRLLDPDGSVLDAVAYGLFGPDEVSFGEGAPAPDPPAGQSLSRRLPTLDTDDNLADFVVLEQPTPGVAETAVPEPACALLFACGLAAVACCPPRRRH